MNKRKIIVRSKNNSAWPKKGGLGGQESGVGGHGVVPLVGYYFN
jgi:hypothetical protein